MGYKMNLVTSLKPTESQTLGLQLLAGSFLISFTILTMSKSYMFPFINLNFQSSLTLGDPIKPISEGSMSSQLSGINLAQERNVTYNETKPGLCGVSNNTTQKKESNDLMQWVGDAKSEDQKLEREPACDYSGPRSVICEMVGDVRIHGKSSTIVVATSSHTHTSKRDEPLRIKPYARKRDATALSDVKEVILKLSNAHDDETPRCTVHRTIPAIVFSAGGYAGNLFHDFSDVLIPLFLTSHQYQGEVQLLVTDARPRWIHKYRRVLSQISRYEMIDLDKDDSIRCFQHAIVGLRCHKEFNIDPMRYPTGFSMANFTQFMRRAYSLERKTITKIGEHHDKQPRLLIISRKITRSFTNIGDIVRMTEELGYEVVVAEANITTEVAEFARIVNSCDVMMGVHGAGLSNLVFLPTNAVMIQIVPWGRLEGNAMYDFGWPASDANLKYLQYEISVEESSLVDQYPREHPILRDPLSIHKRGWNGVKDAFLVRQNVKLDVRRFRVTMLEALRLLRQ